jgi:hypothetical protein
LYGQLGLDKIMKIKRLTATTLACGLFYAGFTIFTEKANAGATASSTATFNAKVLPSCAVTKQFNSTSGNYTQTVTPAAAGGAKRLTRTKTANFDCNSDTVGVSATVILTPPIPVNATSIIGTHQVDISDQTNGDLSINQDGDGTFPGTATTDPDGDIIVVVKSTWTSTGEDLLSGAYAASVAVSVTAN